ncbi:hypothetical protein [Halalkalibacillus halophilus]|uniref:hypothetical protein n=1 Tax=Halalkalibacillus halophilus TaxID=392827 RepID=UPI0003F891F9|nr:hypothetical protein [Halalkalibacillus halophilus]
MFLVISMVLNVLLIGTVWWGYSKLGYVNERVLVDVYRNISQLEELITDQTEDDWSNPTLVTTKMEDLFWALITSMNVGAETNMLSQAELTALIDLQVYLQTYEPVEPFKETNDLTESEKLRYENFGQILSKINFKDDSNDDINKGFILKKVEELVGEL